MKSEISQSWAAIFRLAAAAIPAVGFYRSGSFALGGGGESFDFSWAPPELFLVTSLLISGVAVLATTLGSDPAKAVRKALATRIRGIVDHVNAAFGQSCGSLHALEEEIARLAERLEVAFPVDYADEIRDFLLRNGDDILAGRASLDEAMDRCRDRARQDKAELERVLQAHENALGAVAEVEAALARAPRLRGRLEALYEALTSPDLRSLIGNRQWQDYHEVIAGIVADLERLRDEALDLTSESAGADEPHKAETGPMTPERAYRTLRRRGRPAPAAPAPPATAHHGMLVRRALPPAGFTNRAVDANGGSALPDRRPS